MNPILDITGKDIQDLNDNDLRTLIGLLCEAEVNCNGLQTAGVTWSGHQNAKDGGIDVNVKLVDEPNCNSFIPRANTCIQVKISDMPRSAILKEMKPNGKLRDAINELTSSSGAYIIVSSKSSLSDSNLNKRIGAMQEALKELQNAQNIKVDYYDQGRIAGWVRSHPSIVHWVRDKISRPIQGWKPYENWSRSPEGMESEYITDDELRFYKSSSPNTLGLSGIEGIQALRNNLHNPASSVRLTGLSGVGKTRLLQALFDERLGENPLNKLQVIYTDISDCPNPDPRYFAEQLVALRKPIILAIDNCHPDLHKGLTKICTATGSLVSLITIEYDVTEDEPEETDVFRLENSSINLIEKLIRRRFSYVNQVNARTISVFSGGNAKIAIALANTVKQGESLSKLKDTDLFNRLFHQRNKFDKYLLKAAEVCSLVYSFECSTEKGHEIELQLLSSLSEMSVNELYSHVSDLNRRDLIQKRGNWRAVLPHAFANRLANNALENIPISEIRKVFERGTSERLLTSFSKRLSYLHESDKAKEIAKNWLSEGGILTDMSKLNKLGIELLKNIAPIEPSEVIDAIERAARNDITGRFLSRENDHFIVFSRLLRTLAYDPDLFTRSVNLLCKFALSEKPTENNNSIIQLLRSLYKLYLSGTHAEAEQRLDIISKLIESKIDNELHLAMYLLDASLEVDNFSSHYSFEFGARSRDHGYWPKTLAEIKHWYKLFIDFTLEQATSDALSAIVAKSILARKFRGLWTMGGMFDELENTVNRILEKGPWKEGFIAVNNTLRNDNDRLSPELISRLNMLADRLEPSTLIERARLYVHFCDHYYSNEIDTSDNEEIKDNINKVNAIIRSLAREVVVHDVILHELLEEFLSANGTGLFVFGMGLAEGCIDLRLVWDNFKNTLLSLNHNSRNYQLIQGFLSEISNRDSIAFDRLLDEALNDSLFSEVFPILQASVQHDDKAAKRIIFALENDISPIGSYCNIVHSPILAILTDENLMIIIKLILSKDGGEIIALNMLNRYIKDIRNKESISIEIESFCQNLLLEFDFSRINPNTDNLDYKIGFIIDSCFVNKSAFISAKELCKKLRSASAHYEIEITNFNKVLNALATNQPIAFLEGFFEKDMEIEFGFSKDCLSEIIHHANPLSKISDDLIIEWCSINPTIRYPVIATEIVPFQFSEPENRLVWTLLALIIMKNSIDPIIILNEFKTAFSPMSWSGSGADIMQKCVVLFDDLKIHENPKITEWAKKEEVQFKEQILVERKWANDRESERNERFE